MGDNLARRASKRKAPKREKKQLDFERKIEARVFDRKTMLAIAKLTEKDYFYTLDYPISMGKEAVVFHATAKDGKHVAVKIYRIETSSFLNMYDYLAGDKRFAKVKRNRLDIIIAWAKKEFINLKTAYDMGVHCPKPIAYKRNIVVMEFVGKEGSPYPTLHDNGPADPRHLKHLEREFQTIIDEMKKLYNAGLVHADLSPYNIMITENGPIIIDMGQAVALSHPKAEYFLKRDVRNLVKYFNKYFKRFGIEKNGAKVYEYIIS